MHRCPGTTQISYAGALSTRTRGSCTSLTSIGWNSCCNFSLVVWGTTPVSILSYFPGIKTRKKKKSQKNLRQSPTDENANEFRLFHGLKENNWPFCKCHPMPAPLFILSCNNFLTFQWVPTMCQALSTVGQQTTCLRARAWPQSVFGK